MTSREILIIEDNPHKDKNMREVIKKIGDVVFTSCRDVRTAYPLLQKKTWALALLDMTFQGNQGFGIESKKEPLAGLEILQFMVANQLRFPVIVVTQHTTFADGQINVRSIDEFDSKLRKYFMGIYRGIVHVDLASTEWQSQLSNLVVESLNAQ
jgi:DNA-binding NtrC family response regulator